MVEVRHVSTLIRIVESGIGLAVVPQLTLPLRSTTVVGIKLENLKMVIFRARRKIQRAMGRVFEQQPVVLRPARQSRLDGPSKGSNRMSQDVDHTTAGVDSRKGPCKSSVNPVTGATSSTSSEGVNPS